MAPKGSEQDRLTREILARVHEWEEYAEPYLQDALAAEDRYDGKVQRTREGLGWANTNDLEFTNIVDANAAGRMAVLLSDDPPFRFNATSIEQRREFRAAASNAFMKRDWTQSGAEIRLEEMIHSETLTGTCLGQVGWSFFERYMTDHQPDPKTGKVTAGVRPVPYRDHSVLRNLALWNLAFEVGPWEDINEAAWTCERRWIGDRQIKRLIEWAGKQPGALVQPIEGLALPKEAPTGLADSLEDQRTTSFGVGRTPTRKHLIRWYVGEHPLDDEKPVDYVIVIVNDSKWCIQMPNIYWHGLKGYVMSTFRQKPGHPYGRGVHHILGGAHDEMNELGNTTTDLVTMALAGIWIAKGATPLKQLTLDLTPGSVINLTDFGTGLEKLMPGIEAVPVALNRQDRLRVGMRTAGAASASQQVLPSGAEFSSEVKLMASSAAQRVSGQAKRPAQNVLRPYLFMAHELQRQYNGRKILGVRNGEEFEFSREHLLDDPEIELKLASDGDSSERMLRRVGVLLNPMLNAAKESPRIAAYVEPVLRRIMSLAGIETRLLPEEEEQPAAAPPAPAPGAEALAALAGGAAGGGVPAPIAAPAPAPLAPAPASGVPPEVAAAMARREGRFQAKRAAAR